MTSTRVLTALATFRLRQRIVGLFADSRFTVTVPRSLDLDATAADDHYDVIIVDESIAAGLISRHGTPSGLAHRHATYVLVQATTDPVGAARWTAAGGGPVLSGELPDSMLGNALRSVVSTAQRRAGGSGPGTTAVPPTGPSSTDPAPSPSMSPRPVLAAANLALAPSPADASPPTGRVAIDDVRSRTDAGEPRPWRVVRDALLLEGERRYLESVLRSTAGRVGQAARRAGMSERALFEKMRRHQLRKEDYRHRALER